MNESVVIADTAVAAFEQSVAHLLPVTTRDAAVEWAKHRRALYQQTGELPLSASEAARLRELKGRYRRNRIFVIGNGPSLNKTELSLLKNEYTFAANRFYLMYDRIDWVPTFYAVLDWLVVPDNFLEINGLAGLISFYDKRFQGLLIDKPDVYWYSHHVSDASARRAGYSFDIDRGVHGAGSVVGSAIQIAFFLGFDPIYLIGCDLNYVVPETVVQEGEDVHGTGVKLLLTSTQDDDASHFDPRYFGRGRRWHDPNVKRMIAGHEQCFSAVSAAGGSIFNATVGGNLEVYPRVSYDSLFAGLEKRPGTAPAQTLERPREAHAHLDETQAVARLLGDRRGRGHVMIDVGAHHGTATGHFHKLGWTIHCFEPDAANRAKLSARYAGAENIAIDARAVSDKPATGLVFYVSEESSGISGLSAFRPTHRPAGTVEATTIGDYVRERGLTKVDFLKVDAEGIDFNVLKGVPWDKLKPDVIECEYEDRKTVPMGHTWRDMADYLRGRGYAVYVSEWHAIVRYGIAHDWRRVVPYSGRDIPADAWGNLLAFRKDPGYAAVLAAFDELVQLRPEMPKAGPLAARTATTVKPSGLTARPSGVSSSAPSSGRTRGRPLYAPFGDWLKPRSPRMYRVMQRLRRSVAAISLPRLGSPRLPGSKPLDGGRRRPIYAPFGDWLKPRWPVLYRLLQLGRRGAADVWRRRAWTVPPLLLLACVFLLGFLPPFADYRILMWGGTAFATVMLAVVYVAFRAYQSVNALSTEAAALRSAVAAATRRAAEQERAFRADVERVAISVSERETAFAAALGKRLDETANAANAAESALRAEIDETTDAAKAADSALRAEIDVAVQAAQAREKQMKALEIQLRTVQSRDVSLDVVSALRAMRPIWFGGSAVEALKHEPLVEHGHTLLMAVLADMERETPGALAGKTLIEIGSTRERDPQQGSTEKLAIFTAMTGMRFMTVDMDPRNTERARTVLRYLNPAGEALTEKGEDYLKLHAGALDAVYLDAFDFYHDRHSEDRQSRYELILHTRINDEACWRMHEACAAAIIERMRVGGIVALDDTWLDAEGCYAGKGKLAMPLLLDNGFEIVAGTQQTIALRRIAA